MGGVNLTPPLKEGIGELGTEEEFFEEEEVLAFKVEFPEGGGETNCTPVLLSTAFCIVLKAKSRKMEYIFSAIASTAATNSGIVPPYLLVSECDSFIRDFNERGERDRRKKRRQPRIKSKYTRV